jgi:hypothetical protein
MLLCKKKIMFGIKIVLTKIFSGLFFMSLQHKHIKLTTFILCSFNITLFLTLWFSGNSHFILTLMMSMWMK